MDNDSPVSIQQGVVVRQIRLGDYDDVVALQLRCFPGMKPWTREQLGSQLGTFPEGQICFEYGGRLVASSTSVILDFEMYGGTHTWHDVADSGFIRNHTPDGNTLYGLEIMVDGLQEFGIGVALDIEAGIEGDGAAWGFEFGFGQGDGGGGAGHAGGLDEGLEDSGVVGWAAPDQGLGGGGDDTPERFGELIDGGEEKELIPNISSFNFVVRPEGTYYLSPGDAAGVVTLFLRRTDGKTETLATIPMRPGVGLEVSKDGNTILYTAYDQQTSDLMLVENFK